jgi:hypothetical protein
VRSPRPGSGWSADRRRYRERYHAYMTSAAWFSRRRWWLAEHRTRTGTAAVCAVCGDPDIDMHHLEYTFGRERYEDLCLSVTCTTAGYMLPGTPPRTFGAWVAERPASC